MTTAATRNDTTIEADPDLPTITITREFDHPVEKVFRAYTERDLFAQWIGPRDMGVQIEHFDCRTGGSYRYGSVTPEFEAWFFGSFHEVRPHDRIVQTFTFEGAADGVSLETATFEPLEGGRCRVTSLSVVDTMELRDVILSSGMEVGVNEGYEKLDALLGEISAQE
jgi:uncharacterized protein YndB with AHSA1/START domain